MTVKGLAVQCVLLIAIIIAQPASADGGFKHQHLNLDLPAGWAAHPAANEAAPHIGSLKSSSIAGTSITLDCYRGAMHTLTSTRIRALKTLAEAFPDGQEQLKDKKNIKTTKGKGGWELWKGYVKVGDMTVALAAPMAYVKTPDCWLVAIGFTAENTATQLEKDFLEIIRSAR